VHLRLIGTPTPAAVVVQSNISERIETLKASVPFCVMAILDLSVPEMKETPLNGDYTATYIVKKRLRPLHIVRYSSAVHECRPSAIVEFPERRTEYRSSLAVVLDRQSAL
jgi:hypothetical protein